MLQQVCIEKRAASVIVEKRRPKEGVGLASHAATPALANASASLVFAIDETLLREIIACTNANVLSLKPQNNLSKQALRKNLLLSALAMCKNETL